MPKVVVPDDVVSHPKEHGRTRNKIPDIFSATPSREGGYDACQVPVRLRKVRRNFGFPRRCIGREVLWETLLVVEGEGSELHGSFHQDAKLTFPDPFAPKETKL